jgi:hypothetical protein
MTTSTKRAMRYKFLRLVDNQIWSDSGNEAWTIGEWKTVVGNLELCKHGLHCSSLPFDALCYCQGEIFAEVAVRGEHKADGQKECWREIQIVRAYRWETGDNVSLFRFAAQCLLDHYRGTFWELEEEIAGVRPEEAAEWVVGCTIWLIGEGIEEAVERSFNDRMVKHIDELTPLTGCLENGRETSNIQPQG